MIERLTDDQLRDIAENYSAPPLAAEILALRARVAKLEEVIQTQNGVVVSGTLKLNEARARVAKLEAALKDVRIDFEMWHEKTSIAKIDAALSETVEA